MFEDEQICYVVLPDGTCSYCGKPVEYVETPDGDVEIQERCIYCDAYNSEILFESLLDRENG